MNHKKNVSLLPNIKSIQFTNLINKYLHTRDCAPRAIAAVWRSVYPTESIFKSFATPTQCTRHRYSACTPTRKSLKENGFTSSLLKTLSNVKNGVQQISYPQSCTASNANTNEWHRCLPLVVPTDPMSWTAKTKKLYKPNHKTLRIYIGISLNLLPTPLFQWWACPHGSDVFKWHMLLLRIYSNGATVQQRPLLTRLHNIHQNIFLCSYWTCVQSYRF